MKFIKRQSIKNYILVAAISFIIAVLVNGNYFAVAKSIAKDVIRGRNYEKQVKEIVPSNYIDDETPEIRISNVSDYVQIAFITFEQPVVSDMVVQFFDSDANGTLTHIGDGVVYAGETACQIEIHQYVDSFVLREVSPDSGNVEDISATPVASAVINYNYMSPLSYAKVTMLYYYQQQGLAGIKKILVVFGLLLLCYFLLQVELPNHFRKTRVIALTVIGDASLGILFLRKALEQNRYASYRNAILCMGILCIAAVTFAAYALFIKQLPIHKVYAVSGFVMGLAFMIALPIYQVPDEPTHLYASYELSNWFLGKEIPKDNTIVLREDDYRLPLQTGQFSAEDYQRYYSAVFARAEGTNMVRTDREAAQTWHYQYLAGAVGITIGRLLKLGPVPTLLLGRLLTLILFVIMISYAIKKTPVGKMAMFVLSMLPICLQQSMSYSYDAILIPVVFITVALSIRLAYRDRFALATSDYIILALCAMACMPSKGHAYFLIGFLPWIALGRRYKDDTKNTGRIVIILVLAGMALLLSILFQNRIFPNLEEIPAGYQNYIVWAKAEGYTISGLLRQPKLLLQIIYRTISGYGSYYIETFLGNRLGWLEIFISDTCLKILFFLVVLSCIPRREDELQLSKRTAAELILLGILEVMIIFAGFLLSWTPITEKVIAGVQGRYFIPALIPMFVAFRGRFAKISNSIDAPLCMTSVCTGCWAVISILSNV